MSFVVCPDVSKFQTPLTDVYPRDVLIFRVTFGATVLDSHFLANASEAARLFKAGKIAGAILYTVYTKESVASQYAAVWKAIGPTKPPWLIGIMLDVETWRGQSYALAGDHSVSINSLAGMHAHKLGTYNGVIAYGNWGDLTELYPHRDPRVRFIEAKYSSSIPSRVGKIGQQYTDGDPRWSVPTIGGVKLPRSTVPFGACDHNVFPAYPTGHALRAALSPPVPKPPVPPKPPVAKPLYPASLPQGIRSGDQHWWLGIMPDGTVQLHKDHANVKTIA